MEKELSQRQKTKLATKARRDDMVVKVLSFNINKLSLPKKEYFKLLHLESKLYYNYLIKLSESITDDYGFYTNIDLFDFKTKSNFIDIIWYGEPQLYELKVLSSQIKQGILFKVQNNIKNLSAKKKKGFKVGKLKYKSIVNTPLNQINNTFYLKDNASKLRIQGNKQTFNLVRNKNLNKLSKNLGLGKVSLNQLNDLHILEIANAEIQGSKLNLTVYINKQALSDANLFQGSKLPELNNISIGIDAGIKSELTINTGELYSAIEIDSRKSNKIKKLKKYQKRFNKHISKAKKNKTKIKTNKYWDLKNKVDNIYVDLSNEKIDNANKVVSILKECKQVTFQDENIKSWQHNSGFGFSKYLQKGILGRVYAKLRVLNGGTFNMLGKSEKTTKTCICGNVNNNIGLKDRVYYCLCCDYQNDRDIHSSYIINNKLVSGKDTKVYESKSNLGKTITTAEVLEIISGKLKSKSLDIKLNYYSKNTLEAPCFSAE